MKTLNRREKIIVMSGAPLLVVFLIYQFVVSPVADRMKLLDRIIPKKELELKEIINLKNEYKALKISNGQKDKRIKKKGKGTVTLSYLEDLAKNAGLKNNIKHMKPLGKVESGNYMQNSIEIKLSKIPMERLVKFMFDIKNSKRTLKIMELNILTNKKDSSYLDVKIQIASFELI